MNLTSDAILYYADNPVDFVEDIIRAKPDSNQRAILNSVAKYFVPGQYSSDNAIGVSILAAREAGLWLK